MWGLRDENVCQPDKHGMTYCDRCGWMLPRGVQHPYPSTQTTNAEPQSTLLLSCGGCGRWIALRLSSAGGWARDINRAAVLEGA